jgi:hypothetical protein
LLGDSPRDPQSYREAVSSLDASEWLTAIQSEYDSLLARKTWELVTLPAGRKTVKCKWVFKSKRQADGNIARYKARLCGKGFSQIHALDFNETFAPTVKFTTLRILFSLVAKLDLHCEHSDVDCAFLYADLDEEIYMDQPEGFLQRGDDGEHVICLLKKNIYGLKQAPHNWHRLLNKVLLTPDCVQLRTDPGAYVYRSPSQSGGELLSPVPQDCTPLAHDATSNDSTFNIVVVYVDDILICSTSSEWITTFKLALATKFDIKDLGPCEWLLGMTIERNIHEHTLTIHQGTYIRELMRRFGMADCKPATTPTPTNDPRASPLMEAKDSTHYGSVAGALLYASVATRPDITETFNRLCTFMSNRTVAHMEDAKTYLRYLQRTANTGITFGGEELRLHGFSDANYPTTYPSGCSATSGYVFFLCGGVVSACSRLQPLVTLSTVEAEYQALSLAVQESILLRQMLSELGYPQHDATPIGEDNQAWNLIATTASTSSRTKHLDIRRHFVRDAHQGGLVKIYYVPSNEMLAYIFTKPIPNPQLKKIVSVVMRCSVD